MRTTEDFLQELRRRGAKRLRHVRFRDNRQTLWSLTRRGRALNLHAAFRHAPDSLLDAFAVLVREGRIASEASRSAAERLRAWPPLRKAIRAAQARHAESRRRSQGEAHCCGTPGQRCYLRALFDYFNATRFENTLPHDIPLRLSRRMTSALGHMRPGTREDGLRFVAEIALNVDLMLEGNGADRAETLLHEMAHAADYLESGHRGHGPSWRAWARRVGCSPRTRCDRTIRYRSRRQEAVHRTPPLPAPLYGR